MKIYTQVWVSLFGGLEWTTGPLEWTTGTLEWTTGILEWITGRISHAHKMGKAGLGPYSSNSNLVLQLRY